MIILSLSIGLPFKKALKASITLGIGFIGIFVIFDYFVSKIGPVLNVIVQRTGISQNIMDVGWPPLAATAWSFKLTPVLIVLIIMVNAIMLVTRLTKTINIDIWNYWHFIFLAQLVYYLTNNVFLSITSGLILLVLCVKLADWSAKDVYELSAIEGVSITTLSGVGYYSYTQFLNKIFDKIPGLNTMKADPENIKNKLGFFGEPMFLGIIMGIALGIAAKYSLKDVLELSMNIAAVIYILPKMSGILAEGLMPISEGMKEFMQKKFPNIKDTYIGLDLAILIGNPSAIVTGIILMPIALLLAFVLPGVRFIPLGDLPNIIGAMVMVVVATRGNVVRAVLAGIPMLIAKLYIATAMSGIITDLAIKTGNKVSGYDAAVTSLLDGGNVMRFWLMKLFTGNIWAIAVLPVMTYLLYISYSYSKKQHKALENN